MIFQPPALALLLALSLNALLMAVAGVFAVRLLRHWNPALASERQIALERQSYLVSSLAGLSLLVSLPALALFVYTAERMAPFFTGAMCAVGSLNANAWGWPALIGLLIYFFIATAWLSLHHLDRLGWDYPLIRAKYRLLLLLAPGAVVVASLGWLYFLNLHPEVITSCCGSLFGAQSESVAAEVASLPAAQSMAVFVVTLAVTLLVGGVHLVTGRLGRLYGLLSMVSLLVSLSAIVAFISLYIYEHPNHHCPFCLLQTEHGYAGWLLYPPLFLAAASGMGVALSTASAGKDSLKTLGPMQARRLAWVSVLGFGVFGLLVAGYILRSNLVLIGA
ncbi:MAG: hypothetical protein IPG66_16625 [Hydrogenophilales bacterium]|nr:hypothetical protein [Hydrogenophilales bacterium]